MNVNLTPELEELIQERVASGLYASNSEVVREALRLLVEQDALRQERVAYLKGALAESLEQVRAGQLHDGEALVAELAERYRPGAAAAAPRAKSKSRESKRRRMAAYRLSPRARDGLTRLLDDET